MAYNFAKKQINILGAISVKNIGVKMTEVYRESMFVGRLGGSSDKELAMPDFKLFIDVSRCQHISRLDEIGRVVVEVDKTICRELRSQIDHIIEQIQMEESLLSQRHIQQNPLKKSDSNAIPAFGWSGIELG